MRIFVKHNRNGEVLSISRIDAMPDHLDHPYATLEEGESVIEVPEKTVSSEKDLVRFHETYKVDIKKGKLVKKG
jgi:hypothetical protein